MQKFYDTIGQILSTFRPKKYCIIVREQVWIEDSQKSALPQISWVIFYKSLQRGGVFCNTYTFEFPACGQPAQG